MAKKKVTKKKDPAKAWDNWFDEHVDVIGMGRGTANKKAKSIIKSKVEEELIKQYRRV
jgi:hypothetical protein